MWQAEYFALVRAVTRPSSLSALLWLVAARTCRKDVVLCGYSMPHPSEGKINIRVQTKPDKSAEEAFKGGLETLVAMAEHIGATFATATAAGPGVIVGGSGAASSSSSSSGRRAGAAASAAVGDDDIDLTAAGSAAGGASRSRSTSASSRAGSAAGGAATGGAAASAAAGDKKGRKR